MGFTVSSNQANRAAAWKRRAFVGVHASADHARAEAIRAVGDARLSC